MPDSVQTDVIISPFDQKNLFLDIPFVLLLKHSSLQHINIHRSKQHVPHTTLALLTDPV